ncbi:EamA family transporter [Bacillus thuringiensis]|uniref:EamA family transporter n=5 Tax=Bacillus cereus group TaxID=86661 RepID=A0A9X6Z427_BACTU|nr:MULTISPECIES: EamA family transporter [Bacillus]MED1157157.1 EamA family transporter [Bacillus paranthracis]AFQ15504.1 multidrug ABC transporter [Bacillus thuringiensis HD-771]AFQ25639.1 multidrug ABC transporter [Bacillus thuringiensis HD-789]AJH06022.1 eamA-like transporter family protein [Bacillus thuringiensis HD1002]AJQ58628.1 multidrug ABC transporter [Bacillus thuringiensis serovar morrisoni]
MNSYMLLFIFGIILANYSQILLKKATLQQYDSRIKEYVNPYVIIGYSLFVLNAGLNVIAMKGMELKQASALESLSYIIILIFGWYFLGEKITKRKLIGNMIIIFGVIVYCIQ